jgi:uncharacterized membrane protein YqjE
MRDLIDRLQESVYKVSEQFHRLVQAEIELAKAEVKAKAKEAAPGVGLLVLAGALGFLSLFAVMIAIIWAISLVVPIWLAALITAVGFMVLSGLFALVGKTILNRVGPPVPERAIEVAKGVPADLGLPLPGGSGDGANPEATRG